MLAGVVQLVSVRCRFGHNEIMRRGYAVWQASQSAAALLLTVALAPLIMVAGEPLRRYVLARPAACPSRPGWSRTLRRSRPGTQAEVFGWLSTAIVVGIAAGAAVGGSLITRSGTNASILLGVVGALAAVAVVMLPRPAP